ncbi:MAG: response regulator [Planctomycetota bacterium]|jgi:two-component system chemotaxis response regulator CheY|nr:response regulator [Planctomycetota bacterium]
MSRTVLVVDDSDIIRRVVIRCLELSHVAVETILEAGNGNEALDQLAEHQVDLMLCDLHMPELDGISLLHQLAADKRLATLPVVVISSDRSEERRAELKQLGVRQFLSKPFTPESVGDAIAAHLECSP